MDHMTKEEKFFDEVESEILSKEEEFEMYEQFTSSMVTSKKIEDLIQEIQYLENQQWFQN